MKKNREIFLFGAGAVVDWEGPKTSDLTKLIRESGFSLKDSDTKITEYIYQRLLKSGYTDSEINFETIINVIEELIVYYSEFNQKTQTPSLLRTFLSENDLCNIFNYSIKGGVRKHNYQLQIPYGVDYDFSQSSQLDENPNQFFLQHLLAVLLTHISNKVAKYSHRFNVDKKSVNSMNFRNWMQENYDKSILRLYTLNYDNLFKGLLAEEKIDCFDGFFDTNDNFSRADVLKISSDTQSNIHYNLHGSAYWIVLHPHIYNLPNPEIAKYKYIHLQMNDSVATLQIEKGKTVTISNIITGYQKSQRTKLTPFRQLHCAFDKDCLLADKITIVGYSFNDEHINEAIKIALRYNEKLRLEIIDKFFIENKMDSFLVSNIFPFIRTEWKHPIKLSENCYSFYNDKVIVYNMSFSDFLKQQANNN